MILNWVSLRISGHPFCYRLIVNLEAEILREHSQRQTVRIADWVGSDKQRFRKLMEIFLKGEYRVTQRAAGIVTRCAENHLGLIYPYLGRMIRRMQKPDVHVAVKRNVSRILQLINIQRKLLGRLRQSVLSISRHPGNQ